MNPFLSLMRLKQGDNAQLLLYTHPNRRGAGTPDEVARSKEDRLISEIVDSRREVVMKNRFSGVRARYRTGADNDQVVAPFVGNPVDPRLRREIEG